MKGAFHHETELLPSIFAAGALMSLDRLEATQRDTNNLLSLITAQANARKGVGPHFA